MSKRIKTFWLNLDFIDRDLHSSQRRQILKALNKQNVEVRTNFNFLVKPLPVNGLDRVWMIKLRTRGPLGSIILAVEQQLILLKNLDADVVVVREFNLIQCIPIWFLWRKILHRKWPKFVLDIRSLPADFPGFWKRKQRKKRFDTAVRFAFRYFDGLTMITEKMKNDLQIKAKGFQKKICVWSSGVDPDLFKPKNGVDLLSQPNLKNRFVIMYHGVLSPKRGLQQAIDAIANVRKNHPEILLFLLGTGIAQEELQSQVRNLGLDNHVLIHPPVPYENVPKYINSIQVGLLPFPDLDSWNTSSPIKLYEYLAMGKPVIVTDIEAHRNSLGEFKSSFFIPDHQPESIVSGIEAVLKKKGELNALGKIARKKAIEEFTWDDQARRIKTYFELLLSDNFLDRA
jgi:glycosyltransferase involved in cell wall biosynthesis